MTTSGQSTPQNTGPSTHIPANHPALQLTGRFHRTPETNLVFRWSGTQISIRFSASAIDATLEDLAARQTDDGEGNVLAVLLDGQPTKKLILNPGRGTYRLVENLAAGEHTLTLFKQTEASIGGVAFSGFTLQNGSVLPPLPRPKRRIEFYGDSITCGYGNEGQRVDEPFRPSTENHYLSFGQITARALNAECHVAAWSGEGILRNALGEVVNPVPSLYDQILPPSPDPGWTFTEWQPQVIVINLGTNDFLTGIPDKKAFIETYLTLLKKLSGHYNAPHIFCCLGPLLSDDDPPGEKKLSIARGYLEELVQQANEAGMPTVHFLEFQPIQSDEFGAWWHPNISAHRRMAATLVKAIRDVMNWQE